MPRLTITFGPADHSIATGTADRLVARTNADELDVGDILIANQDLTVRVLGPAAVSDYMEQCRVLMIETDEVALKHDQDRLWWVEVME